MRYQMLHKPMHDAGAPERKQEKISFFSVSMDEISERCGKLHYKSGINGDAEKE